MKNVFIGLLLASVVILGINATLSPQQTEQYAVVNVIEKSSRLIIRTSVTGQETQVINLKVDDVDGEDLVDFKPVMDELAKLNAQGFELVNGSVSSVTYGSFKHNTMRPYHSFILKKK